jgi:CheY-like chemotaxis protein
LATVPVIILSVTENRNYGFLLGASEYLSKPVDRSRLIDVLLRLDGDSHRSVLVVDDDADSRRILSNAVRAEGFAVHEAENGKVALEHVLERRPSLIFLDLLMPEMDGFEFIARLRALSQGAGIPVVVLTAKEIGPEDRARLNGHVTSLHQKGSKRIEELAAEVREFVAHHPSSSFPTPSSDS